jgi:hypothetical protein
VDSPPPATPPPPRAVAAEQSPPSPNAQRPNLAQPPAVAQVAPPRPLLVRFPARIIHPPALQNAAGSQLNTTALKFQLRTHRRCGPREVPPNSGHFIHLDCNLHLAIASAKPFSPRKLNLMLVGGLKLDTAIGQAGTPASLGQGSEAALPDAVDHRKDGTEGPVEDQGQVGSCTAFSLASAMDNGIRRQNNGDTMSPLHIWSHYGFPVIKNAGDDNLNKTIVAWNEWPYDERVACEIDQSGDGDCGPYLPPVVPGSAKLDPLVQAKVKDSDSKGHWKVTEYDEITPAAPDTIAAMLASGADVWFTMDVGSTWLSLQGDSIADWNEGQIDGGHAVLFAGYRHKNGQRQFLVHNSWGEDWGDHGFAYVSEAMVKRFIKHAYKVVVSDSTQPPPPSDSNALTDDDCGEDQLVDSVTGQCATICPDDSRPANGQCDHDASAKKPGAPVHSLRLLKH